MDSFPPKLEPGDLHIVALPLDLPEPALARADAWLDPAERERAARFIFARDRARFVAAHGLLRRTLGGALGRDPAALRFGVAALGKPYVVDEPLRFNLSHSGDLALVAFGMAEVGVDVEEMRAGVAFRDLAATQFSPHERAALERRRSPDELARAFFRIWTRKEAFIKLLGRGLSMPLDAFDVSADPDGGLVKSDWGRDDAARFDLRSIDVGPRHQAAFAVEGRASRVVRWETIDTERPLRLFVGDTGITSVFRDHR